MTKEAERKLFEQEFSQMLCFARTEKGIYVDEGARMAWRAWRRRALIAEERQEKREAAA